MLSSSPPPAVTPTERAVSPNNQPAMVKKRGFWRRLGHTFATPFREISEVSDQIKEMKTQEEAQKRRHAERDAALTAVQQSVAVMQSMLEEDRFSIDASTRKRIEAITEQLLAMAGSQKSVGVSNTSTASVDPAQQQQNHTANPAAAAAGPDTSKLESEISDIVYNVTGTRLEGSDASMEMIGLDSLGSMLVAASLRKQLNVKVAPASIKEHGTSLQIFAEHIQSLR